MRLAFVVTILVVAACGRTALEEDLPANHGAPTATWRVRPRSAAITTTWSWVGSMSTSCILMCESAADAGVTVHTELEQGPSPTWDAGSCVLERGFRFALVDEGGEFLGPPGSYLPSTEDLEAGQVLGHLAHTPFYELFVSFER
jgi:hypothetical protein